jgi:hypothetical protein
MASTSSLRASMVAKEHDTPKRSTLAPNDRPCDATLRQLSGSGDTRRRPQGIDQHPSCANSMAWKGAAWKAFRREYEVSYLSTSRVPGPAFCMVRYSPWRCRNAARGPVTSRKPRRASPFPQEASRPWPGGDSRYAACRFDGPARSKRAVHTRPARWRYRCAGKVRRGAFCRSSLRRHRIPHPIDHIIAHVQKAAALWRLQPFVRASGADIAAEFFLRLSFIMPGACAPSTADKIPLDRARAANSFAGSITPVTAVMWLTKRVAERIRHRRGIGYRPRQRHFLHDHPLSFGAQVPWMLPAGMLLIGHQHFVAGFQIESVRDVTVGFRGVSQQGDFIPRATNKCGQRVAGFVPRRIAPDKIVSGSVCARCSASR